MNAEDVEWVKHALVEAERRECISKILDMSCKEAVPPGNNYCSDVFRVKIKAMKNSGETEERSAIYKIIPTSEMKIQGAKEKGLFKNEARMYTETLHQIEKIYQTYDPGSEPLWPTFYGVKGDYDAYLLEDLTPFGFKGVDRADELDFEHCNLVLKGLAKYHAGAFKLLEKNSGLSKELAARSVFMEEAHVFLPRVSSMMQKVLEKWPRQWHEYIDKFIDFDKEFLPIVKKAFEEDYNMKTICHGDLWTTNVLFKYNEEGQPVQLRLLDFQIIFFGSPCFDIHHLFSTSLKYEVLDRRLELLELYHKYLVKYLELFDYQKDLPTFDQLLEDFEKSKPFQYFMLLTMKPLFMNPHSFVDEDGKKVEGEAIFLYKFMYDGEYYLKTLRRILTEMKELGYFRK